MTRRRWFGLALLVVVVWLVVCGVLLLRAASQLRDARDSAKAAKAELDADAVVEGTALPELREARDGFSSAASATSNPVLAPARFLPVIGRQLRAVDALGEAAAEVSSAAVKALERSKSALAAPSGTGPERVAQLRALTTAIDEANRRVRAVTDLGPRKALLPPIADAHNELAEQLAETREALGDAAAGSQAGLRLLDGPRRYLLIAANNAEMRAGSGMWLSGGVLQTAAGSVDLDEMEPTYRIADPPDGQVPISDVDLADRWGIPFEVGDDFRGLMPSPRFAASAEVGSAMWTAAGNPPVDGIIVLDPIALSYILRATGPVLVEGRSVDADAVLPLLLNEQYRNVAAGSSANADRRDLQGRLASAVVDAIDAGRWAPADLASSLAKAVAGRHLMAWSGDAADQRGWTAAGADGALTPDSLLISVLNRGANKLDYYMRTSVDADVRSKRTGTDVTLRIALQNTAPSNESRYILGPQTPGIWPDGRYIGVVTVNVPGHATNVRIDGVAVPVIEGPDGPTRVVAQQIRLDRGAQTEIVVRFSLPQERRRMIVEPSARYPAITYRWRDREWADLSARVLKF